MKDRLIEILLDGVTFTDEYKFPARLQAEYVADRLLANGVIVPPCEVGSEVYFADHENKSAWYGNLVSYSLDAAHLWFNCHYKCGLNMWHPIEDFDKTVFLTREEAEKALAEREGKG